MRTSSVSKYFGITALGLIIAALAFTVGYQLWAYHDFQQSYPAPGKLVAVDGTMMHLHCTGSGTPVTILEAGAGSWSQDWQTVQSELSGHTTVCSYDRAGIGWSERRSEPRHINNLVRELHLLLEAAALEPPYVLVGASFGGIIVQLFEHRYPAAVSAVVLVDGRPTKYFKAYETIVPQASEHLEDEMETILTLHDIGLLAAVVNLTPPQGTPEHLMDLYQHPGRMTKHAAATARERVDGAENESKAQVIGHMGDKPLLVISHGQPGMFENRSGVSANQAQALEAMFADQQLELSRLSDNSRHVIAQQSGHAIQFDQPELLVEEIVRLVESNLR